MHVYQIMLDTSSLHSVLYVTNTSLQLGERMIYSHMSTVLRLRSPIVTGKQRNKVYKRQAMSPSVRGEGVRMQPGHLGPLGPLQHSIP